MTTTTDQHCYANVPADFVGTPEQITANRNSHAWYTTGDGETVCDTCDSKPWHVGATHPCGTHPRRIWRDLTDRRDLTDAEASALGLNDDGWDF